MDLINSVPHPPAYDTLYLTMKSGTDEEDTIEFVKTESGIVMETGFFDSVIWYSTQTKYIAADYIGETVDILLLDYVPISEDTLCETAYNFPCPELMCN